MSSYHCKHLSYQLLDHNTLQVKHWHVADRHIMCLSDLWTLHYKVLLVAMSFGDSSTRPQVEDDRHRSKGFFLQASGTRSSLLGDLFASVSSTTQHGNFQRLYRDLTWFQARLEFPSAFKYFSGATCMIDLLNCQNSEDQHGCCSDN